MEKWQLTVHSKFPLGFFYEMCGIHLTVLQLKCMIKVYSGVIVNADFVSLWFKYFIGNGKF